MLSDISPLLACLQIFVKLTVVPYMLLMIRSLKCYPDVGLFARNKICYSNLEPARSDHLKTYDDDHTVTWDLLTERLMCRWT